MATRIGCWVEGWVKALKKIIFSRKKYLHYVLLMIISRWWLVIKNFAAKAAKKIFVQLVLTVGHVLGMISLSISTNKSKVLMTNDQSTFLKQQYVIHYPHDCLCYVRIVNLFKRCQQGLRKWKGWPKTFLGQKISFIWNQESIRIGIILVLSLTWK